MAARNRPYLAQATKDRIRATMLIKRLQDHALNKVEMSPTQVQAAKILLGKVIPDIKSVDHTGGTDNVMRLEITTYAHTQAPLPVAAKRLPAPAVDEPGARDKESDRVLAS